MEMVTSHGGESIMKPELSESPRIAGVPEPTVDDFRIADKTFDLDPSDSPKGSPRHGLVRFGRASIRAETGREKYDL